MKTMLTLAAVAMAVLLGVSNLQATNAAKDETKVTLKNMHICCGACVNGIKKAVQDINGVSVEVNQKARTTVITAESDELAQKAIDAIADVGYHADSDNRKLAVKDDSGVKEGKVTRLELTGVHNCCGGCNKAVKKAIATVDGVEADTAKSKSKSFVVEGNFDALALVKALNKEGFHVKLKK